MTILEKVTALLGEGAVLEPSTDRVPRIAPGSPDAVALLLGTAHQEGWRVRIEGAGTWLQSDAPSDLALTTRRLDRVPSIEPSDLTATAEAGIGLDQLRQQLADRGAWLGIDPPGLAGRTLGSIVATATAGPLRHGFGPIKDHLLGVTFVTGDGRMVQSGGRVMKNVAGYDLTRLQAGGFGAFGVIVLVHLRLRALPRADVTYVLEGAREDLTQVGEDIAAAGLTPAALELVSPALARRERWVLAVRLAGSAALVAGDEAGLRAATGGRLTPLRSEEAHLFWTRAAEGIAARPAAAPGGRRVDRGESGRRRAALGRRDHGGSAAAPAAHTRGARGPTDPGAGALARAQRRGAFRRLPRRGRPAGRGLAPDVLSQRGVRRGGRRQ